MPDFEIRTQPIQAWALELRGGERVQFNGRLMADCMGEMLQCADMNGCLEPGAVGLTDGCGETFARHHEATGCAEQGFGIRVKQILSNPTPNIPSIPGGGPGLPGRQPGAQTGVDWLPGE